MYNLDKNISVASVIHSFRIPGIYTILSSHSKHLIQAYPNQNKTPLRFPFKRNPPSDKNELTKLHTKTIMMMEV